MTWKERFTIVTASIFFVILHSSSGAATNEPSYQNGLDSTPQQVTPGGEVFTKRYLAKDCESSYSPTCMKLDIVSFIEKLSESSDYSIFPGLSVVREARGNKVKTADVVAELARSFPNDPDKRLDSFLMFKLNSYLDSHALRMKLVDDGEENKVGDARKGGGGGGFGGGGGGGKKGGMGGLMAMAMMMKGTLGALGMGALALLAGKALMTALMSLMLSAIIGLKSLTSGGHKSTTYEIVTKPVYSHSNTHSSSHEDVHGGGGGGGHSGYGHSGYGRAMNIDLPKHLKEE